MPSEAELIDALILCGGGGIRPLASVAIHRCRVEIAR
jgi:hypothetical protein